MNDRRPPTEPDPTEIYGVGYWSHQVREGLTELRKRGARGEIVDLIVGALSDLPSEHIK